MYESYFGVTEKPFSIAPDPRFVYLSPAHEEALAHLVYGVQEPGGFVLLTGEVGTGKTTLLRTLLERLPDNVDLAMVLNPKLTPSEFVATVCDELGIAVPEERASLKTLVDRLNRHLLESYAAGRRTVLVIDEAQGLSADVLEQVRLLTNLETTREKLLEIILVGQPELRETLARNDLRQLAQRITARYHLKPLDSDEVRHYVHHRLSIAGANRRLFTDGALRRLARISGGIPRLINEVADRALLGAYAGERQEVDARLIGHAACQVFGEPLRPVSWKPWAAASLTLAMAVGGAVWWTQQGTPGIEDLVETVTDAGDQAEPSRPVVVTIQAPTAEAAARETETVLNEEVSPATEPMPEPAGKDVVPEVETGTASQVETLGEEGVDVWLARVGPALTFEAAMDQLFAAWGAAFDPNGGDACDQARQQGLACLYQTGDRDALVALDRPAVLLLSTPVAETHVTVSAVNGDRVTLGSGPQAREVKWVELDPYWTENFLVLWRPPEGLTGDLLRPGDSGPAVYWLRERLAAITGQDPPDAGDPEVYDSRLQEIVRSFQLVNRLEPDGLVGVQTLLKLGQADPPAPGPRLRPGS